MSRPIRRLAFKLGRELHIDVDVIMSWSLNKIYEYVAFYRTENDEWAKEYKDSNMTDEERMNEFAMILGAR